LTTATGAVLLGGHQTARSWMLGWTAIAGANFAAGGGTIIDVGGATVTVGITESQSGTGLLYVGTGELVMIGQPQYRAQVCYLSYPTLPNPILPNST